MKQTTQRTELAVCSRPPSRPFKTKFGDRIKAEFDLQNGETIAVFANDDSPMGEVAKGDEAYLLYNGKDYVFGNVAMRADTYTPALAAVPARAVGSGNAEKTKQQVEAIQRETKRLAFCLQEVQQNDTLRLLSEDGQRQAATTIFIQTTKF